MKSSLKSPQHTGQRRCKSPSVTFTSMFLCTQFSHTILKNGRMKRKRMQFETKNARNKMLATWMNELSAAAQIAHMSEHVCFPHGSAQRISTGNSSLQMAQVNGGASILNTPARAVSTAATAARPALAKRCSAEAVTPAPAVAVVALAIVTVLESLTDL